MVQVGTCCGQGEVLPAILIASRTLTSHFCMQNYWKPMEVSCDHLRITQICKTWTTNSYVNTLSHCQHL